MRHAIETAPRDGKAVILEHQPTGTYDVAQWSAQAGQWITKNGEPSKITPTHWHPMLDDKDPQQGKTHASSRLWPSSPRARRLTTACLIALITAVLMRLYSGSGPDTPLLSVDLQTTGSPALRPQTNADQAEVGATTKAVQARQDAEASSARPAIEGPDVRLQTAAANPAQSLEQEHQETVAPAQETIAARQVPTTSATEGRQALDEERARSDALKSELAIARREVELQAQQLRAASEEAWQSRQAATADSARALEQERQKTAALAQEAAAARQELTTEAAKHREALDEERASSAALKTELIAAQRENETQAAQLRKASEEIGQLRQVAAADAAEQLERERQQTAALAREAAAARQELVTSTAKHRQALDEERLRQAARWSELAAAQREIEAQATQLREAREEIGQLKQASAADSAQSVEQEQQKTAARQELTASAAKHLQALDEEHARGAVLTGELAAAKHENELQTAQLLKAGEEMGQLKQTTELAMADLRQSLQQERERTQRMAREIESAQRENAVRITPERTASGSISRAAHVIEVAATSQPPAIEAQGSPEATRLIARARALLGQGDIGAARIVLERAAETGSAQASFTLAETYDPVMLSAWGTYGTRGDATKARDLYAKAHAGGILDAKDRLERLDQ